MVSGKNHSECPLFPASSWSSGSRRHHYLEVALQIGHRYLRISQMREKTVDSRRSHHSFKVAVRHPGKYPAGIIKTRALF